MSDTPKVTPPSPPAVPTLLGLGSPRPPRSEVTRVFLGTFRQTGALLGGVWLGVIAFCSVFAPLLANSHPILLKHKTEGWSSPLLASLTPADVSLLVAVLVGGVLLGLRRVPTGKRLMIFLGAMAVTTSAALLFIRNPPNIVYDKYRVMEEQGETAFVLRTLIPYSPSDRLGDQFDPDAPNPRSPSAQHLMGTEINGADVLSKMIHACRIAMCVGFITTGISVVLGIVIGGLMGYFSGIVDLIGMRAVEIFDAIPTLYLILSIIAFYGQGTGTLYLIMVVIGLTGWSGYAVFIRAEFLRLRQQDFVQAGIAAGLPLRSVLFKHMLPNGVTPVLVSASFGIAGAINIENALSFLGIGLVEEPSWGQLLGQATAVGGSFNWWLAVYPGVALTITMFAFILIGESLRDVIDPYTNRHNT